jgi:hypothetical protein
LYHQISENLFYQKLYFLTQQFFIMKKISLHLLFLLFALQIAIAQSPVKSEFRLVSDKTTADVDDIITVTIQAKEFKKMEGFQWSIKWKPEDYELISADIKNLPPDPAGNSHNEVAKGTLLFSWVFSVLPINLDDNTSIYELKYKAKKSGLVDGICFGADVLIIEVLKTGIAGETVPVQADFIGLSCGFVWTKTSKGVKTISALSSPTGTKELSNFESRAFPNPFSTSFNLQANIQSADNVLITIYDLLGKNVFSKTYHNIENGESINIDASDFSNGQYIYNIKTNVGISTGRLIKN